MACRCDWRLENVPIIFQTYITSLVLNQFIDTGLSFAYLPRGALDKIAS
jgi:hypothetical protein